MSAGAWSGGAAGSTAGESPARGEGVTDPTEARISRPKRSAVSGAGFIVSGAGLAAALNVALGGGVEAQPVARKVNTRPKVRAA